MFVLILNNNINKILLKLVTHKNDTIVPEFLQWSLAWQGVEWRRSVEKIDPTHNAAGCVEEDHGYVGTNEVQREMERLASKQNQMEAIARATFHFQTSKNNNL